MAFTNETLIRTHTGWQNTDQVTSELLEQQLAAVHALLLAELSPEYHSATEARLQLAETELVTAAVLRSLAVESGVRDRDIRTTNLTLRASGRAESLASLAAEEEARGWQHAAPFLRPMTTTLPLRLVTPE